LFYNVHETLAVIVSKVYLFYVSFAGLGLGLSLEGAGIGLGLVLRRAGLGLGTAGLDHKTATVCTKFFKPNMLVHKILVTLKPDNY